MFEGAFSPFHWLVVLAIALVVFGPKRVPEIGKSLGTAIRGFRDALKGEEPPTAPPTTPKPSGPTGIVDGNGPKA